MARKKVRRFLTGGETDEAADKAAGLEASKGEDVGFFERLRMGNIDDPSSEAYRRFGAGRGRASRVPVEEAKAIPVAEIKAQAAKEAAQTAQASPPASSQASYDPEYIDTSVKETDRTPKQSFGAAFKAARGAGDKEFTWQGKRYTTQTKEEAQKAKAAPAAKTRVSSNYEDAGIAQKETPTASPTVSDTYPDEIKRGRGSSAESDRQKAYEEADAAAKTPEGQRKLKEQAEKEAIQRVYPEEYLIGGPGLKGVAAAAKKLATPKLRTIEQAALPPPQKLLTGPSKAELLARDRAARAAANREEMLRENARRYGLDPKSERFKETSEAVRRSLGGDEFSVLKKGGKVKSYKAGGMVSSASRRGDGIAQRGKTRGKYI